MTNLNSESGFEYLSADGFKVLEEKLNCLRKQRRQEIADRLEYAKSMGDLTENAEYQTAKEEQLINESRIAEIEDILSRAVIIAKETGVEIRLGSLVFVKKDKSDQAEKYYIVGSEEANPIKGKISYESPLGNALLGRKKGENVRVLTPNGKIKYTIIDVG